MEIRIRNKKTTEMDRHIRQFLYDREKDELVYRNMFGSSVYRISFSSATALQDLEAGEIYSYYELVGKE